MNKDDISVLILALITIAVFTLPAIYVCKRQTNAIKYCFDKYQNLEDIKTCREIFFK